MPRERIFDAFKPLLIELGLLFPARVCGPASQEKVQGRSSRPPLLPLPVLVDRGRIEQAHIVVLRRIDLMLLARLERPCSNQGQEEKESRLWHLPSSANEPTAVQL